MSFYLHRPSVRKSFLICFGPQMLIPHHPKALRAVIVSDAFIESPSFYLEKVNGREYTLGIRGFVRQSRFNDWFGKTGKGKLVV